MMFPQEIYLDPSSSKSSPDEYPPCRFGVVLQFHAEPGMIYDAYATYVRDATLVPPDRLMVYFNSSAPETRLFNSLEDGVTLNEFRVRSEVGLKIERGYTLPVRLYVSQEGDAIQYKIVDRVLRDRASGTNWRDLGRS
jgi:hypothetical protein